MATPPAGRRLLSLGAHSFIHFFNVYLQPVHLQSHQPHPAADAVAGQQPPLRVLHHPDHHRQLRRHVHGHPPPQRRQDHAGPRAGELDILIDVEYQCQNLKNPTDELLR